MAEYRVDELAREAGATVRNVRAYQDRGLLHSPRRVGRVALYDDTHVTRLRLIGRLLERGYTLANIAELLVAWERGHDLPVVLGLADMLTSPWSDEASATITAEELTALFPGVAPRFVEQAADLGFIEIDGGRLRVPSPRLLNAGAELYAAGVPIEAILEHAGALRRDVTRIARRFVRLVTDHVLGGYLDRPDELTDAELDHIADLVRRLRPLAEMAVDAELARAMERATLASVGDRMPGASGIRPARAARGGAARWDSQRR
jgi:DNA-binding transcriptional MerR regulator